MPKQAEVTTGEIWRARGSVNQSTLWRDLNAGLFAGCEPTLVREGTNQSEGVRYVWSTHALVRAAWIRRLIELRLARSDVKELVDRGRSPRTAAGLPK